MCHQTLLQAAILSCRFQSEFLRGQMLEMGQLYKNSHFVLIHHEYLMMANFSVGKGRYQ